MVGRIYRFVSNDSRFWLLCQGGNAMFSKNIFAQRLKMLRKSRKCTQLTLAELLGITRTQISDLENGKTSTSIERLCMLADYFNVSIDYLVGRTDLPIVLTDDCVELFSPEEMELIEKHRGKTTE